eukprot:gene6975-4939_t
MGCCASAASDFRDIYAEMLGTFQLIPKTADFTSKPKDVDIGRRSKRFEGLSGAKPSATKDPFECRPTEVNLPLFMSNTEIAWKLNSIHPYNGLLTKETVISLCFVRSVKSYEEALKSKVMKKLPTGARRGREWEVFRWDFRLWMLGMCEFYHVLALLVENKSIPLNAGKWFQSIQSKNKDFFRLNDSGDLSEEARKAIEESDALKIKQKDINSKFITALEKEMGSIFSTQHGPGGPSVAKTTGAIYDAAAKYWKEKKETLLQYIPESRKATERRKLKESQTHAQDGIPLICLVEWLTIRYVRSLCGVEENENSYLPKLRAEEEYLPSLFAKEFQPEIPGLKDVLNEDDDVRNSIAAEEAQMRKMLEAELEDLMWRNEAEPEEAHARQLLEAEINDAFAIAKLEDEERAVRKCLEDDCEKEREDVQAHVLCQVALTRALEELLGGEAKTREEVMQEEEQTWGRLIVDEKNLLAELLKKAAAKEQERSQQLLTHLLAELEEEEETNRRAIIEDESQEKDKLQRIADEVVGRSTERAAAIARIEEEEGVARNKVLASEAAIREMMLLDAIKSYQDAKDGEAQRAGNEPIQECKGNLDMWRKMIRRIDMIDKLLEDDGLPPEERDALLAEKDQIQNNLHSLYRRLSHQSDNLTGDHCKVGLYEELELKTLFPDRAPCDRTSDRAFIATLENAEVKVITDLGRFRNFMRTYVTLLDLYGDTADAEGRKWEDGVMALDEEVNHIVLLKAYDRGDIKDPDWFQESTVSGVIASVFQKGTHECPDHINRIEFEDLVTILLENRPDPSGKYTLRPLEELAEKIGADGNQEKQREFMSNFLEALPENVKTTEMDKGLEPSVEGVAKTANLKLYSRFDKHPATIAVDFCTQTMYITDETTPIQRYLERVMESQTPPRPPCTPGSAANPDAASPAASIMPFTCRAVFIATAVVRCFEDTRTDEKEVIPFSTWQSPVSYDWYDAALQEVARVLDTSKEEIAAGGLAYLRANKIKGGYVEPSEEESSLPNPMKRAFYLLKKFGAANEAPGVRVEDVAQMCLFVQLQHEFGEDRLFKDFFQYAFKKNYILPEDRRSTKFAPYKTPEEAWKKIHEILFGDKTDMDLYTEFFSLSLGCRDIPMCVEDSVVIDEEHKMNIEEFIKGFKRKYMSELEVFLLGNDGEVLFHEAAAYTTLDVPFTARRYRSFLSYISGYIISTTMFAVKYTEDTDQLHDDELLAYPVPKEFVELLVYITDEEFHTPKQNTADEIYTAISSKDTDLATVADWYATYLVERLPPTQYDQWELLAPTIPFTCSREDREARRPMVDEMQKRSIQISLDERGTQDGCEDYYFPTRAVGEVLAEKYDMRLVAEALQCSTAAARARRTQAAAQQKEASEAPAVEVDQQTPTERFKEWLEEHVVPQVNTAIGRSDLGRCELHWTGVRFVLQYIHHCMESFFLSEEVCKEVEGMIKADVGPSGRPANLTAFMKKKAPQHCTYMDAEHIEATVMAVQRLSNGAPGSEVAEVKEEILQLANPEGPKAPPPAKALTRDTSAPVDPEAVGHIIASRLVKYSMSVYQKAVQAYKEAIETKLTDAFEETLLSGRGMKDAAKKIEQVASYWERLRFLLPHRHTAQHRQRRRRIYEMMDRKGKGYLTVPDLQFGNNDVLHLYMFREDTLPVLFRAFFAVKEQAFALEDVVYLTGGAEQLITPPEFCGFLEYFYRYMEIYFMFDVLTCAGRVQNDLHVQPDASTSSQCLTDLPPMQRVDSTGRQYSPGTALRAAAENPYQLTMESAKTSKVVNIHQFKLCRYLLRHWGCAVADVEDLFRQINRRCAQRGELQFTDFAIWASQLHLCPEGYGHRCDDKSDELAAIELGLLEEDRKAAAKENTAEDQQAAMEAENDVVTEYIPFNDPIPFNVNKTYDLPRTFTARHQLLYILFHPPYLKKKYPFIYIYIDIYIYIYTYYYYKVSSSPSYLSVSFAILSPSEGDDNDPIGRARHRVYVLLKELPSVVIPPPVALPRLAPGVTLEHAMLYMYSPVLRLFRLFFLLFKFLSDALNFSIFFFYDFPPGRSNPRSYFHTRGGKGGSRATSPGLFFLSLCVCGGGGRKSLDRLLLGSDLDQSLCLCLCTHTSPLALKKNTFSSSSSFFFLILVSSPSYLTNPISFLFFSFFLIFHFLSFLAFLYKGPLLRGGERERERTNTTEATEYRLSLQRVRASSSGLLSSPPPPENDGRRCRFCSSLLLLCKKMRSNFGPPAFPTRKGRSRKGPPGEAQDPQPPSGSSGAIPVLSLPGFRTGVPGRRTCTGGPPGPTSSTRLDGARPSSRLVGDSRGGGTDGVREGGAMTSAWRPPQSWLGAGSPSSLAGSTGLIGSRIVPRTVCVAAPTTYEEFQKHRGFKLSNAVPPESTSQEPRPTPASMSCEPLQEGVYSSRIIRPDDSKDVLHVSASSGEDADSRLSPPIILQAPQGQQEPEGERGAWDHLSSASPPLGAGGPNPLLGGDASPPNTAGGYERRYGLLLLEEREAHRKETDRLWLRMKRCEEQAGYERERRMAVEQELRRTQMQSLGREEAALRWKLLCEALMDGERTLWGAAPPPSCAGSSCSPPHMNSSRAAVRAVTPRRPTNSRGRLTAGNEGSRVSRLQGQPMGSGAASGPPNTDADGSADAMCITNVTNTATTTYVRDSDLLRALQHAEQRIRVLERLQREAERKEKERQEAAAAAEEQAGQACDGPGAATGAMKAPHREAEEKQRRQEPFGKGTLVDGGIHTMAISALDSAVVDLDPPLFVPPLPFSSVSPTAAGGPINQDSGTGDLLCRRRPSSNFGGDGGEVASSPSLKGRLPHSAGLAGSTHHMPAFATSRRLGDPLESGRSHTSSGGRQTSPRLAGCAGGEDSFTGEGFGLRDGLMVRLKEEYRPISHSLSKKKNGFSIGSADVTKNSTHTYNRYYIYVCTWIQIIYAKRKYIHVKVPHYLMINKRHMLPFYGIPAREHPPHPIALLLPRSL